MRQHTIYPALAAVALLALDAASGPAPARACMSDARPSIYANGRLARINTQVPRTAAQLATWAPFIFTQSYLVHRPIMLTENRRQVARTLTAAAMRRPWRWQFGDGSAARSTAYGWSVTHTYTRPGHWRIDVDAYDPRSKAWYPFDQVVIVVRR